MVIYSVCVDESRRRTWTTPPKEGPRSLRNPLTYLSAYTASRRPAAAAVQIRPPRGRCCCYYLSCCCRDQESLPPHSFHARSVPLLPSIHTCWLTHLPCCTGAGQGCIHIISSPFPRSPVSPPPYIYICIDTTPLTTPSPSFLFIRSCAIKPGHIMSPKTPPSTWKKKEERAEKRGGRAFSLSSQPASHGPVVVVVLSGAGVSASPTQSVSHGGWSDDMDGYLGFFVRCLLFGALSGRDFWSQRDGTCAPLDLDCGSLVIIFLWSIAA